MGPKVSQKVAFWDTLAAFFERNKDIISVMVRKSRFLDEICGFLKSPTLDPLAQGQSKRNCSFSDWPLKLLLYCVSISFVNISGTCGIGISKRRFKIKLASKICESLSFYVVAPFLATS